MSSPLVNLPIQRIRFIVLAVNSQASGSPTSSEYYMRCAALRFVRSGGLTEYSYYNTTQNAQYSSSYSAYRLFDSSNSTYWYIGYPSYQSRVAIPAGSKVEEWDANYLSCHWAEGSFNTPLPYEYFVEGNGGNFLLATYSSYASSNPTRFVILGQDTDDEWHILCDRSSERVICENYSSVWVPVTAAPSANGSENDGAISGRLNTGFDAVMPCNWYMYVKSSAIDAKLSTSLDIATKGLYGTNAPSAIHGLMHTKSNAFRSSIWGKLQFAYDRDAAALATTVSELSAGVLGAIYNNRGCAIGGGDVFGSRYLIPLTDKIPLRLSCVWGEYKTVKAIPHLYGNASVTPIPYGTDNKQFVIADHAIQSVLEVYVNDVRVNTYEFVNTSDNTGHSIALLTFVDQIETSDDVRVVCNGKIHPKTGGMLLNPAEILWDILANISGLEITENDLADFRDSCYQLGIESHGGIISADVTIRSQIDEIMLSVGGVWSGGMEGIAKVYPFSEVV